MKASKIIWVLPLAVAAAAGLYFLSPGPAALTAPVLSQAPTDSQTPPPPERPAGAPLYPVPKAPAPPDVLVAALPEIDASDALITELLAGTLKGMPMQLVQTHGFIRRVVATVDNLPRDKAAVRLWPLKPVGGQVRVSDDAGGWVLEAANGTRYAAYVALAEALDPAAAMSVYARLYPLFQQAYRELGYPDAHFNDRLVAVIDHLLMAPEIEGPIALLQPKVLYRYADRETESRSAGQKIMIRMGVDNARRVKLRLREFRKALTASPVER